MLTYVNHDLPKYGRREALIKIHRVGVCGTDLHAFEGVQPYFTYPRILGHELAAEFVEGDGNGFVPGDKVTVLPYINCGNCVACHNGKPNCCVSMRVCGVHIDGGMSEYFVVPYSALVRGDGLSFEELAIVEPLAIGAHSLRRGGLTGGEHVLVIGAGPIGLGIMELAALQGARVIAMDVSESRLEFCKANFKVEAVLNPTSDNVSERLQTITNGDMPTLIIDATGNLKAINNAFQWMAHGGRYVLVGLQRGDITFPHPEFHKRESTLMSSRNATRADFDYVIENIRNKKISASKFITHTIQFDSVSGEFPTLSDHRRGVVKAIIDMSGIASSERTLTKTLL